MRIGAAFGNLGFPSKGLARFAEHTWLEGDLPVNVWAHGVTVDEFKPWLAWTSRCRRVVADRSLVGDDFFRLAFPNPKSVRDLAVARADVAYKAGDIRFNRANRAHFERLVSGRQSAVMMELK